MHTLVTDGSFSSNQTQVKVKHRSCRPREKNKACPKVVPLLFLTGRTELATLEGTKFKTHNSTHGAPQGSGFGPNLLVSCNPTTITPIGSECLFTAMLATLNFTLSPVPPPTPSTSAFSIHLQLQLNLLQPT